MPRRNGLTVIASGFDDGRFIANGGATSPDLSAKELASRATRGAPKKRWNAFRTTPYDSRYRVISAGGQQRVHSHSMCVYSRTANLTLAAPESRPETIFNESNCIRHGDGFNTPWCSNRRLFAFFKGRCGSQSHSRRSPCAVRLPLITCNGD